MHVVLWTCVDVEVLLNTIDTSRLTKTSACVSTVQNSVNYSLELIAYFHHEREPSIENHRSNDCFALTVEPLTVEI